MTLHLVTSSPPPTPEPDPPRPLLYWWLYVHPYVFAGLMMEAALKAWARPTKVKVK